MSKELLELAERCEKATVEQQAELLEEAFRLCDPPPRQMYSKAVRLIKTPRFAEWSHRFDLFSDKLACEAFLDAAMTLVPEGCFWTAMNAKDGGDRPIIGAGLAIVAAPDDISARDPSEAATPALALCAAALRARAQKGSA
jgi:hypothetical protein